jgi:site-specific DNA-methyltransferase (adenine-specific)
MIEPRLLRGDCVEVLRGLEENSVDAVVTDPPYGLAFMGKKWDYSVPGVEVWRECLRVLKPGGYLLAFAGTRTQHRMAVNIEDAGFHIRDLIAWVYGSGFPKSHDVSKAIDKAAGAEREVLGTQTKARSSTGDSALPSLDGTTVYKTWDITAPATEAAKQWEGWGTALKPALEPITVARKPFGGTIAENVLTWGTGAINVDGCRIEHNEECKVLAPSLANINNPSEKCRQAGRRNSVLELKPNGRWPANLIHDGSDEVNDNFPDDSARFFYCPKADKADRDAGLSRAETSAADKTNRQPGSAGINPYAGTRVPSRNNHPTVKPVALMQYLVRLVTQPGGVVLDPFMGSGTTGRACLAEGFGFVGIERDPDYFDLASERMRRVQLPLFGGA